MGMRIAVLRNDDGDEIERTDSDVARWEAHGYKLVGYKDSDEELQRNHENSLKMIEEAQRREAEAVQKRIDEAKKIAKSLSKKG